MIVNNKNSSDTVSWHFIVYFIAISFIIFPFMGLVYAYIIRSMGLYLFSGAVIFIPWMAAFFGYCIGYVTTVFIIRNKQFNSPKIEFFLILFALLMAYYFHWIIWVDSIINSDGSRLNQLFTLLTEPTVLLDSITNINEVGTWYIDDDEDLQLGTTKGKTLAIFWIGEFILMTIYPFFVGDNFNKKSNHN